MPDEAPQAGTPAPETTPTPAPEPAPEVTPAPTETAPETALDNTVGHALEQFQQIGRGSSAAIAQPIVPAQPPARKFDGLEENEVPLFKKMSNEAYSKLYPDYLEFKRIRAEHEKVLKERDEALGKHFYEEPNAYMLLPEYGEAVMAENNLSQELQHWQQQLANVEAGNKWTALQLNAQGQVVAVPDQEPSPQAKADILSAIAQAHTLRQSWQAKMAQVQGNFSSQHKNYLGSLQQTRTKIFAGADLNKLSEMSKSKLEMFPAYMRGRQEIKLLSEALVLIDALNFALGKAKGSQASANIQARTAKAAGPTADSLAPGMNNASSGKVGDAWDAFKKAKMLGIA